MPARVLARGELKVLEDASRLRGDPLSTYRGELVDFTG